MNDEEETVTIRIPAKAAEFADFYATVCNENRDTLLGKILVEKLKEIRDKLKQIPHLKVPEVWEQW